jgi:hypothetical protein
MLGVPSPALVGANVVLVAASLDHHGNARLLVDTGAPFTLVDPAPFGDTLPQQTKVNVDIGLGALTIDHVPALQVTTSTMNGLDLGGILGGDVLRQFSTQFDYRDQTLRLGDGAQPSDVEQPGATLAFKLQGGGRVPVDLTSSIDFPATRIPVTVTLDGVDHPFVLDSGASEVTVRSAVFSALVADGRAQLGGFPIATAAGATTATVTRARAITVAGEAVATPPVMSIGDSLIETLSSEVGHPVDGLLGGSFLREFLVTIDYPRGELHLQRYATRAHVVDEFQRVGIAIGAGTAAHRFAVSAVYAGSDAQAKSISVGDELVAVDGQALDGLDIVAADRLLDGAPGAQHQLSLGATAQTTLANTTVTVRVDDLVPVPQ